MVKEKIERITLNGRDYRRFTWERDGVPASRQYRFQVMTIRGHWRDLPTRARYVIPAIHAALDNHRTNA